METGLQDLDITAAAVQLNPATRTDDMKTGTTFSNSYFAFLTLHPRGEGGLVKKV